MSFLLNFVRHVCSWGEKVEGSGVLGVCYILQFLGFLFSAFVQIRCANAGMRLKVVVGQKILKDLKVLLVISLSLMSHWLLSTSDGGRTLGL